MVHLDEEENRAYCIHWLVYVDSEAFDEVVELDDDEQVALVDNVDKDAYHLQDNEYPLEVRSNFWKWENRFCYFSLIFVQLTVELDKDHWMVLEEYGVDRWHYDALVLDNSVEQRQDLVALKL